MAMASRPINLSCQQDLEWGFSFNYNPFYYFLSHLTPPFNKLAAFHDNYRGVGVMCKGAEEEKRNREENPASNPGATSVTGCRN